MATAAAGFITIPEWMFFGVIGFAAICAFIAIMLILMLKSNPLISVFLQASKGERRLACVHYPSGQAVFTIPKRVDVKGEGAPYWEVDGTIRFKDVTGEKWENVDDIKILHYTSRCPTPLATHQAVAIDQLNTMLAWKGFSTKGCINDVFYMIAQSAKGVKAEQEAWMKLQIKDEQVVAKIREIIQYIKNNPELRYQLFKSGAFTYQTAVSVIDQIIGSDVSNTSNLISFVEDRTRRKLQDRTSDLAKYAIILAPIILAICIGGVIFLTGTGMV